VRWKTSTILGGDWDDTPVRWQIEIAEGFHVEDLCRERGQLELQALVLVKHREPIPAWRMT
jgi:hypothetical protein